MYYLDRDHIFVVSAKSVGKNIPCCIFLQMYVCIHAFYCLVRVVIQQRLYFQAFPWLSGDPPICLYSCVLASVTLVNQLWCYVCVSKIKVAFVFLVVGHGHTPTRNYM